jgi:hypothetical protein
LGALLAEGSHSLDETRLDVVVEEKLREDLELANQELVAVVHGRVRDTRAVRTKTVADVIDIDRAEEEEKKKKKKRTCKTELVSDQEQASQERVEGLSIYQ